MALDKLPGAGKEPTEVSFATKDSEQTFVSHSREFTKIPLDKGLLGKFFGGQGYAPLNLCGFVVGLVFIAGIALSLINTKVDPTIYWTTVALPIITGTLGFSLGRNQQ